MATKPIANRYSEGGKGRNSILRSVDIFQAGTHRGKVYTTRDLDQMVANFKRHSVGKNPNVAVPMAVPKLMPGAPAVLGHEEEQAILERSDLPSAGWPVRLWREGPKLKADIAGVAPSVAKAIATHRYRTVSAEVYDDPPEPLGGKGKMLRRISFLGADVPQVKSLDHLPMPEPEPEGHSEQFAWFEPVLLKFSEFKTTPNTKGCFTCFFEATKMERDELISQLGQLGANTDVLADVPDEALAEMLRVCQGAAVNHAGDVPEPHSSWDDEEMPEPDGDEQAQEYADRARRMGEKAKKWMEKYCGMEPEKPSQYIEPDPVGVQGGGSVPPPGPVTKHPSKVTMQYNEAQLNQTVEKIVGKVIASQLKPAMDELVKFRETSLESDRKNSIRKFCEANGPLGTKKLSKADLDETSPLSVISRLYRADARKVVEKFTENGRKVECTDLDLQMREIEARQPMRFNEGTKSGLGGKAGEATGEVEAVVTQHFEKFREDYSKFGVKSADELLTSFKTYPAEHQATQLAAYKKQLVS